VTSFHHQPDKRSTLFSYPASCRPITPSLGLIARHPNLVDDLSESQIKDICGKLRPLVPKSNVRQRAGNRSTQPRELTTAPQISGGQIDGYWNADKLVLSMHR
jgi:hypothetical protein